MVPTSPDWSFALNLVAENYLRGVQVWSDSALTLRGLSDRRIWVWAEKKSETVQLIKTWLWDFFSELSCSQKIIKTFWVLLMSLSHTHPHLHDEERWVDWVSRLGFYERYGFYSAWRFQFSLHEITSLTQPTKFVPLSEQMTKGVPPEQWSVIFPLQRSLYPLMEQPQDERNVSSYETSVSTPMGYII